MINLKETKLGDEIKDLGEFKDIFTGKVRLLKITYSIQDVDGTTADIGLEHNDFWKNNVSQKEGEVKG